MRSNAKKDKNFNVLVAQYAGIMRVGCRLVKR